MNLVNGTSENRTERQNRLREQLIAGYLASAERDVKITAEWSDIDAEMWNRYMGEDEDGAEAHPYAPLF